MNGLSKICFTVFLIIGLTGCATTKIDKWHDTDNVAVTSIPRVEIDTAVKVTPIDIYIDPTVVKVDASGPEVDLLLYEAEIESTRDIKKMGLSETECLARAMYYEARGEGTVGMRAVAFVVHNRVVSKRFPDTYCGVIFQKQQFSFVSDGHPDVIIERGIYKKALAMAVNLLQNGGFQRLKSPVGKALFFESYPSRARWTKTGTRYIVSTIGNHNFYN